jgi:hypothetical protein
VGPDGWIPPQRRRQWGPEVQPSTPHHCNYNSPCQLFIAQSVLLPLLSRSRGTQRGVSEKTPVQSVDLYSDKMSSDKERENHVYMAKLAEQAERYDGISLDSIYVSDGQI